MDSVIKVFGAKQWHDTVSIIGNKEALIRLKNVIENAIKNEYSIDEFLESDGEGYNIEVKLHEGGFYSDKWNNIPVHYTDEIASEKNEEYWKNLFNLMKKDRRENKIDKLEGE